MSDNLYDRIIIALLSVRCDLEEPCEDCRILASQDAEVLTDLLIDMAGKGELLKAIDRMNR
jgi:hypothetical protein